MSIRRVCSVALVLIVTGRCSAAELPKVLFFANPQRSDNHIIHRIKPDELSPAERHFVEITKGILDVTTTQDGAALTAENLKKYDAVVFFTALNPPGDKKALVEWVAAGGAFVGIHSTSNTYKNYRPFVDMLGATYRARPWRTRTKPLVTVNILTKDVKHPITKGLPKSFEVTDDIYLFKGFDLEKIDVLLRLDPKSLDLTKVRGEDAIMPIAWTKTYGKGRVFYTALGDDEAVWKNANFRNHLIQAVHWTMTK